MPSLRAPCAASPVLKLLGSGKESIGGEAVNVESRRVALVGGTEHTNDWNRTDVRSKHLGTGLGVAGKGLTRGHVNVKPLNIDI